MKKKSINFSTRKVDYYFDADLDMVNKFSPEENTIFLTDENVYAAHARKFKGKKTIVIPAGEKHKNQSTVDEVINELIAMGADRKTLLVGVGGGVVTDICGYVGSVYMRGIRFGFAPSSILAMVDASIGGKNGIDVGAYKNLVGTINQPSFLLYDMKLLRSLPKEEWINGFAEIIKHACIKDAALFSELESNSIAALRKNANSLSSLISRNVLLKSKVVKQDEFEQGERKLLNFGHTLGHAIETAYALPHGHAVSIGMIAASKISEDVLGFSETKRISSLLRKYGLPVQLDFDKSRAIEMVKMDKKKIRSTMSFILLKKIGKAVIQPMEMDELEEYIKQLQP